MDEMTPEIVRVLTIVVPLGEFPQVEGESEWAAWELTALYLYLATRLDEEPPEEEE